MRDLRADILSMLSGAFLLVGAIPANAADRVETLLGTLADAAGPSGYEEPVRAIMVRELKPLATRVSYDGHGVGNRATWHLRTADHARCTHG
jgi:hypothetical protein